MSENNSLSSFDQLSTEILFDIFDYLSSNDIIHTFFHLNQRLNAIVLQHLRFLNHFATPTSNFSFWQMILPTISSQIKCLAITTSGSGLSLDLFPNLNCLIISSPVPIYHDELTSILKSEKFKKLNSFKVKSEIVSSEKYSYYPPLFYKILENENSLQIFESSLELYTYLRTVENLKITVNLRSLSLKLVELICVVSLLHYTPNLKYLNARLSAISLGNQSQPDRDLSHIKLKKLSIILQRDGVYPETFPFLTRFIKQFSSSLVYLLLSLEKININQFQFNGSLLQQQFLESMIQLKSFHLYTQIQSYIPYTPVNEEPMDMENLLSTFQTQFWIDHQWTVGTHGTYLYTLPFHFDKLNDFIDFDQIKATNSEILNSPWTWSHVKSIDPSKSSKLSLNMIKQMRAKMRNLTSITFSFQLMNNLFTDAYETNETDITLDSITTVHCQYEDLSTIKQWLIHIFPNTTHLMLTDPQPTTSLPDRIVFLQKFDEYFRRKRTTTTDYVSSFRVQYVDIKIMIRNGDDVYQYVRHLMKELLNMFENVQSFILHFDQLNEFPHIVPFTDLDKMIEVLNTTNISEMYQTKHIYNCLQFAKRNDK